MILQSKEIFHLLEHKNVTDFIKTHAAEDPSALALKFAGKTAFDLGTVLRYMQLWQKARTKLPLWHSHFCALTAKSFEQCTSQAVAAYKSLLFNGKTYVNITGGLGVDDWAFSQVFAQGYSIELDPEIHELALYNQRKLGIENISRITGDSLQWLDQFDMDIDLLYADPDRRAANTKDHSLANSSPDIIRNLDLLQSKARQLLVKLSPMADISLTLRQLPGISDIWIISLEGEVKELLVLSRKGYSATVQVHAVSLDKQGQPQVFTHPYQPMQQIEAQRPGEQGWLAEPDAALIKAGLATAYQQSLGLIPVNAESTLAWAPQVLPHYQGRMLRILQNMPYKPDRIASYLDGLGIKQANITKRIFRENVDTLRKRLRLAEGGNEYLFFTTGADGACMYHARRDQ